MSRLCGMEYFPFKLTQLPHLLFSTHPCLGLMSKKSWRASATNLRISTHSWLGANGGSSSACPNAAEELLIDCRMTQRRLTQVDITYSAMLQGVAIWCSAVPVFGAEFSCMRAFAFFHGQSLATSAPGPTNLWILHFSARLKPYHIFQVNCDTIVLICSSIHIW